MMHYVRATAHLLNCYQSGNLKLIGYSDVDWDGDLDESKSTSSYVSTLGVGAVSWCNKKQDYIALSTMEVEYVACSLDTREVIWLSRFLQGLNVTLGVDDLIEMLRDNTATI